MNPSLSCIIMAFNEANSLEKVAREIHNVLSNIGSSYEIIIIDDGSCDGTGMLAERLTGELNNLRIVHHESNKGLGGVYRTGFSYARGHFVTFFPADGQFPADIIKQFMPFMNTADMVLGYLPKTNRSLLARLLSSGERILYSLLFGKLPKFQGIMMFKRALLEELELKSKGRGWTIVMELIIRAYRGGYRIVSIPTRLRLRMNGKSKVNNLSNIWANLKQAIILKAYI